MQKLMTKISTLKTTRVLVLVSTLSIGFISIACETSHTESDSPGLFGGNNHEETKYFFLYIIHDRIPSIRDKASALHHPIRGSLRPLLLYEKTQIRQYDPTLGSVPWLVYRPLILMRLYHTH